MYTYNENAYYYYYWIVNFFAVLATLRTGRFAFFFLPAQNLLLSRVAATGFIGISV